MTESTISIIQNDGKYAFREYLPNICVVMENPNEDPSKVITAVKEFCQVCKGGVKDHFMRDKYHYDPILWQQVSFLVHVTLLILL